MPDTLEHYLKIGLGRALPFVKQHYTPDYRPLILNACVHHAGFDKQVEGSRARYMLEILDATKDFKFYRDAILDALTRLTPGGDYFDIEQHYELAAHIARRGDPQMRQAIIRNFLSTRVLGDFASEAALIKLDGLQGFVLVAEYFSQHISTHGDQSAPARQTNTPDVRLRYALEANMGKFKAREALKKLYASHPHLKSVLDLVMQKVKRPPRRIVSLTYDEIKADIAAPTYGRKYGIGLYYIWGESAPYSDLLRAAADLLVETDQDALRNYLAIFWYRPFPLDCSPIFPWTQVEHERLAHSALMALININHPSVRAFALESIEKGFKVGRVVEMLDVNYREEDWRIIEPLTRQVTDAEDYHSLGFSIFDIIDHHPTVEFVPTLLNLYEHNPCSQCRERAVERLHRLAAIPAWMREECLHDANYRLRERMVTEFAP